jgi:hopanoid biosynthesis associated protein HpnK
MEAQGGTVSLTCRRGRAERSPRIIGGSCGKPGPDIPRPGGSLVRPEQAADGGTEQREDGSLRRRGGELEVILNADDFGSSSAVNRGVARAHRQGLLTSASLIVGGPAAAEAVAMARDMPSLAVGLHVVAADGRAVMPRKDVPRLVDRRGCLPAGPARAGWRYALDAKCRRELLGEIEAQFDLFAGTGLPLSHVDGHAHLHLHPFLVGTIVDLAVRHRAGGFRVPRGEWRESLAYDRRGFWAMTAWASIFALLVRRARRRAVRGGLVTARRVYGLVRSGRMDETYVTSLIRRLDVSPVEIYFHPSDSPKAVRWGPNPYDLAALLSPALARAVREKGLRLTSYAALAARRDGRAA